MNIPLGLLMLYTSTPGNCFEVISFLACFMLEKSPPGKCVGMNITPGRRMLYTSTPGQCIEMKSFLGVVRAC